MIWTILSALIVGSIAYLIWSGRRAIHYRGVRRSELPEFLQNLFEDAVGSKLILEDETSGLVCVVEKTGCDSTEQLFAIRLRSVDAVPMPTLEGAVPVGSSSTVVPASLDEFQVDTRVPRAGGVEHLALRFSQLLDSLGSGPGRSYHLYFDAKLDPESLRGRYEDDLRDQGASPIRRRIAEVGLQALNRRARRQNASVAAPSKDSSHTLK